VITGAEHEVSDDSAKSELNRCHVPSWCAALRNRTANIRHRFVAHTSIRFGFPKKELGTLNAAYCLRLPSVNPRKQALGGGLEVPFLLYRFLWYSADGILQ
jgi:hypothetical protein